MEDLASKKRATAFLRNNRPDYLTDPKTFGLDDLRWPVQDVEGSDAPLLMNTDSSSAVSDGNLHRFPWALCHANFRCVAGPFEAKVI